MEHRLRPVPRIDGEDVAEALVQIHVGKDANRAPDESDRPNQRGDFRAIANLRQEGSNPKDQNADDGEQMKGQDIFPSGGQRGGGSVFRQLEGEGRQIEAIVEDLI